MSITIEKNDILFSNDNGPSLWYDKDGFFVVLRSFDGEKKLYGRKAIEEYFDTRGADAPPWASLERFVSMFEAFKEKYAPIRVRYSDGLKSLEIRHPALSHVVHYQYETETYKVLLVDSYNQYSGKDSITEFFATKGLEVPWEIFDALVEDFWKLIESFK